MTADTDTGGCISAELGGCAGSLARRTSRSGCTVAVRCDRHQAEHDAHMDEVDAGLAERYPGWNIPGSPPPPGWDPADAGECWDGD